MLQAHRLIKLSDMEQKENQRYSAQVFRQYEQATQFSKMQALNMGLMEGEGLYALILILFQGCYLVATGYLDPELTKYFIQAVYMVNTAAIYKTILDIHPNLHESEFFNQPDLTYYKDQVDLVKQYREILIDGEPLSKKDFKLIQQYISYVQQDGIIFNATVYENIIYGNHGYDQRMKRIILAAKMERAHDFIQNILNQNQMEQLHYLEDRNIFYYKIFYNNNKQRILQQYYFLNNLSKFILNYFKFKLIKNLNCFIFFSEIQNLFNQVMINVSSLFILLKLLRVQNYKINSFIIINAFIRVYVLLASTEPMRINVYQDGLVIFAIKPYVAPTSNNLEDVCIHLTNYAINKENPNFIFNNDVSNIDVGHKRSIKSVFDKLEQEGYNIQKLWQDMYKLFIKTFCTVQPIFNHHQKSCQLDNYANNMCFEILGFDIFLNHKLQSYLLEVNLTPSFSTDTPLDSLIKKNLIMDSLILMNKRIITIKILNRLKTETYLIRKQTVIEKQKKLRDEYENKNLGDYIKIYPLQDSGEYTRFTEFASQLLDNWTGTNIRKNQKKEINETSNKNIRQSVNSSLRPSILPKIKDRQINLSEYQNDESEIKNISRQVAIQYQIKKQQQLNMKVVQQISQSFFIQISEIIKINFVLLIRNNNYLKFNKCDNITLIQYNILSIFQQKFNTLQGFSKILNML
ncbi:unnamed protein product [Paramecium primaurelia]|uniref:ABC transmembrane type-1 domain-containing protein n=1 Tax=Paramecium primaurelia TaxID=5886 RepID=A0A8S1LZU2_PARPR|nr:unnamed protein product [Paramecium primaurelia]